MKKNKLFITLFSFSTFFNNVQAQVNNIPPKTVNKTKIELVYSHYIQDGDHSAVTGGKGTEELFVYAPKVKLSTTFKDRNTLSLEVGVDIITSASTDKIDFAVSSASRIDARNFANIGYTKQLKKQDIELSIGSGYSLESDYLSIPFNLGIFYTPKDKMRTYSFNFQSFFDDLRWGRLHPDYKKPSLLVYPQELRHTEWFDVYQRNSYNFKFGLTQIINKRNIIGIYPELGYQKGLLSTPFHRVYFSDSSLKVENLPQQRLKGVLAIKMNSFIGDRFVLKTEVSFYKDDFGISALTLENTSAIKLNNPFTIAPFFRLFIQRGTSFFEPIRERDVAEKYYTSDYDLSTFKSYSLGLNIRYAPQKYIHKQFLFHEVQLRYAFSYRTDGLQAHIVSVSFSGTRFGKDVSTGKL